MGIAFVFSFSELPLRCGELTQIYIHEYHSDLKDGREIKYPSSQNKKYHRHYMPVHSADLLPNISYGTKLFISWTYLKSLQ